METASQFPTGRSRSAADVFALVRVRRDITLGAEARSWGSGITERVLLQLAMVIMTMIVRLSANHPAECEQLQQGECCKNKASHFVVSRFVSFDFSTSVKGQAEIRDLTLTLATKR